MNHATWTLLLFVVVVAGDVLGLVVDLWLLGCRGWSITEEVWRYPALGVPLVCWQLLGAVALAAHFWGE